MEGIMMRPEGHTMEDEGAKKKWDAWKREENISKTDAKRQYILYLINTMRVYVSGTPEARELLGELEYLWDQIKDLSYSEDDSYLDNHRINHPFTDRSVGAPLVYSYMDQSDRLSAGTPWPLQSLASASASQQLKNNSEQIYLHSRRTALVLPYDSSLYPKQHKKSISRTINLLGKPSDNFDVPPSTLDDFRTWQGQINLIINKLSRDFASRQTSNGIQPHGDSDSNSEADIDLNQKYRKKIIRILGYLGQHLLHLAKNMSISLFAMFFIVWCVNRSVTVKRTVVRKNLDGKSLRELVINMIINTDENKWFIRILSFINSVLGFV